MQSIHETSQLTQSPKSNRSWTRTLAAGALMLGVALPGVVSAQDEKAEKPYSSPAQVVLTGDEVPNYLVTEHFYAYLLDALAEGHGVWTRYALTPLGLEPETRAEAALEAFLLDVRNTVTSGLHVAYDTEAEPQRFQADQLNFRMEKMAAMAVVHSEMIELLEKVGVGTEGMIQFMETEIRPGVTVSIEAPVEKSAFDSRVDQEAIFAFYDEAFEAARQGLELPDTAARAQKSSGGGDVLSLVGAAQFPNCGEGLVGRRGWHQLTLVSKNRANRLTLQGRLKECGWIFDDFIGVGCNRTAVATAAGQRISCYSQAGDTLCRNIREHRAWQHYNVARNGLFPLTGSNNSNCTKPNRCDDFYPPPR
ncbi:MAG: hypothetical protein AAGM22_14475 [Acidobacteriota bacterium]